MKCFVLMPISDCGEYENGHFKRVYEHLIKPAIELAGFEPVRADEIKQTNFIVVDIIKNIISAEICLCDLSSRNPNVLYELGFRQAFNLPVSLIKDELTDRIFDIQGFRDIQYHSSLRIDEVQIKIEEIANNIKTTYENKGKDINSLIDLLKITPAHLENPIQLTAETTILLDLIKEINSKVSFIQDKIQFNTEISNTSDFECDSLKSLKINDNVLHHRFGKGKVLSINMRNDKPDDTIAVIDFNQFGQKQLLTKFAKLKIIE